MNNSSYLSTGSDVDGDSGSTGVDRCPRPCCQPESLTAEQVAGIEYRQARRRETFRAEFCRRCPSCGSRWVRPVLVTTRRGVRVLVTDRRTWICADCVREWTPGVIG